MASPAKLISAFEIQLKRRQSADSTSPVKKRRTRSSNSIEIVSGPPKTSNTKLDLSPHVNLEDIGSMLKSTPRKITNGVETVMSGGGHLPKKKTPKKVEAKPSSVADTVGEDETVVVNGNDNSQKSTQKRVMPKMLPKLKGQAKKGKKKAKPQMTVTIDDDEVDEVEEVGVINNIQPIEEAATLFSWLIHPLPIDNFFRDNWEKSPLHIKRSKSNYYKLLMSTPQIDEILRKYIILFTKNLDITAYVNGQRETHNPEGRALPSVVWDFYANGCSVRMLNPQTYIPKLQSLNASLQEFFGCFVGANFYLTPPGSQGFAPHYDDIEAFILQIEGKKRWRLYKPRNPSEYLPRYSSENFNDSEIGEPILDVILNAGDLLYFPRGTIHQGETLNDSHSLHVTLSVYQKNSWGDFLEKLLPQALKIAIAEDSSFREGLPLNYLNEVGAVHRDRNTDARRKFFEKTKKLLHKMIDKIDVDAAADQMAKSHIHDFLPQVLAPVELECSVLQDGERMTENGIVENRVEIEPDTRIRLARGHAVRLVHEENTWRIYYSADNSKEYHEYDVQYLEVGEEHVPAIREIILKYPDFVTVDDLPVEGEHNRVQIARDLWEKCIVLTDVPLPIVD